MKWQKFMDRIPKEEKKTKLSAKDLNELSKWQLNGREIKKLGQDGTPLVCCEGLGDGFGEAGVGN